jgi:hypothetical protein
MGTGLLGSEGLGLLLQQGGQGALGEAGGGRLSDLFHGAEIDVQSRPLLAAGASGDDLAPLGGQVERPKLKGKPKDEVKGLGSLTVGVLRGAARERVEQEFDPIIGLNVITFSDDVAAVRRTTVSDDDDEDVDVVVISAGESHRVLGAKDGQGGAVVERLT